MRERERERERGFLTSILVVLQENRMLVATLQSWVITIYQMNRIGDAESYIYQHLWVDELGWTICGLLCKSTLPKFDFELTQAKYKLTKRIN